MGSLLDRDTIDQAAAIRRGDVTSRQLVEESIERLDAADGALNFLVHRQYERALRDADAADEALRQERAAPLIGVPFLLKDFRGREAGEPYVMGLRPLRDAGFRPTTDSEVALRFRRLGLIPLGRTNVPQMALMGTTEPELWGPTHNPYNPTLTPGGSSGGSAVGVAVRAVAAAHANDIAGSIRIPAAHCGLVGLKCGRGVTVLSQPHDARTGMNTEGVVTRSVRDTALLTDALTAQRLGLADAVDDRPRRLRVALWTEAFNGAPVDPANAAAAELAARTLEAEGYSVEVSSPPGLANPTFWDAMKAVLAANAAAELDAWSVKLGRTLDEDDVEANTWSIVQSARKLDGGAVMAALGELHAVAHGAAQWWSEVDVLVTPTTAGAPTVLGEYTRSYVAGAASAFTRPFNATGQPAISVPVGWPDDGVPRGAQLIGRPGGEALLVSLAGLLEEALPWVGRQPSTV